MLSPSGGSPYIHAPTKGVSAAFAILFAISGTLCVYQNTKYKTWRPLWMLPLTGLVLVAGLVCREVAAYYPQSTFAASEGLLLCGGCLLTCSLYIILFCIIFQQPHLSPISTSWMYVIPMIFNATIISLVCQGAATLFNPPNSPALTPSSLPILQAGIVLELVFTSGFFGLLGAFHHRYAVDTKTSGRDDRKLKTVVYVLYMSANLLMVSNVFRVVQIFSGPHSPAWREEVFFWVFGIGSLLFCMLGLNVLHPGKFFEPCAARPCVGMGEAEREL